MKKFRNLTKFNISVFTICAFIFLIGIYRDAHAATPVSITFTNPQCYVGQSVTVAMTISPQTPGVQGIVLKYSSEYLSMTGWSGGLSNGANASVTYNKEIIRINIDNSNTGAIVPTYYFTFKALKAGTGKIEILEVGDISDPNGEANAYIINKETFGTLEWERYRDLIEAADEILICGLVSSICVVSNALILRAMFPEKDISFLSEASAGLTPEDHAAACTIIKCNHINIK